MAKITWSIEGDPTDPPKKKKIPIIGYRNPEGLWEMPDGTTYANPEPYVLKDEKYTAGSYPAVNGKIPQGRKYMMYAESNTPDGWVEYAEGGPIKPPKKAPTLYVDDPNDPRLKAYNDSLNLYKAYQKQDILMGSNDTADGVKANEWIKKNPMKETAWTTKQLKDYRAKSIPFKRFDGTIEMISKDFQNEKDMFNGFFASEKDRELIRYYKSLGFTDNQIMYHTSPDIVSDEIRPIGNYYDGSAISPKYKNPIQPVELRQYTPLEPKQPNIAQSQFAQEELQPRYVEPVQKPPKAVNRYTAAGYPMVGDKKVPKGRVYSKDKWEIIED
jgi:hypothetical protein